LRVEFLARQRHFLVFNNVNAGSELHPASNTNIAAVSSAGVKAARI
jgi:hypothetical protein